MGTFLGTMLFAPSDLTLTETFLVVGAGHGSALVYEGAVWVREYRSTKNHRKQLESDYDC